VAARSDKPAIRGGGSRGARPQTRLEKRLEKPVCSAGRFDRFKGLHPGPGLC
jgi:hypothetical protein